MLNKNTLGVKKVRGQSEATYKQAGALISAGAKKLATSQKTFNSLNDIQYIFHDWLCHLATFLL